VEIKETVTMHHGLYQSKTFLVIS